MMKKEYSDTELKELLLDLDEADDVDVTRWEADFIDSIFRWRGNFTEGQRSKIKEVLDRYNRL